LKEHLSITIEKKIVEVLKKYAVQEKRSLSQVVELAIESFFDRSRAPKEGIITSENTENFEEVSEVKAINPLLESF